MTDDSGSATIYVMGAAAVIAAAAVPVVLVGLGFAVHRDAVRAADLAAIGGAQTSLSDSAAACSVAAQVAMVNGAELRTCSLAASELTIRVVVDTSLPFTPELSATSRAGLRR